MSVMSRSERIALEELELRIWCKESNDAATHVAQDPITNIGYIGRIVVDTWVWNPEDLNQRVGRHPWTDYNIIPPWKPTLSSIEDRMEDWAKGKLLPILQYRRNLAVDTLDSPLLPEHISHIKSLCDEIEADLVEFDDDEFDDEFDFDNDDDAYWPMAEIIHERIQNLEPRQLFQDDVNNNKELCKKGLELLSDIMEKAKDINGIQGNYLELCNIFKEIHNN
jgi:hypothetical protein